MHKSGVFSKLSLSVPSLLFWIAVALFDHSLYTAATIVAAILHELGHIAVIRLCGMRVTEITVLPYGLEIRTSRPPASFFEDIAVNAAGCAVNFLSVPVFYLLCVVIPGKTGEFFSLLSAASLILGVLNSLPVSTLDGGCVLEAFLSLIFSYSSVYLITRLLGFFTLVTVWILSVYVFMFSGYNYSLFAMCLWLFARLFC